MFIPGVLTGLVQGHDFLVVGRSPDAAPATQTKYAFDASMLNGNNPVRRDVAMLPAAGWLLLAFKTDNPGAWLYVPPNTPFASQNSVANAFVLECTATSHGTFLVGWG
jgi:FtsP/CotA-like multicopper oxidase with cupredoxin domain